MSGPVTAIASDFWKQEIAARGALSFLLHHVRRRWGGHAAVLAAVFAAVACAVGSQYGVKNLVDTLGTKNLADSELWVAVAILVGLVAGDNLLWRLAGWISTYCFVAVGGDMRLGLFHHLSGHGTRYFTEQFPGGLASRITTAANAAWTIENSLTWNTIPPAAAVIGSVAVLGLVNWQMTAVLFVVIAALGILIARAAAKRNHLHQRYAGRAAAVSGDLTDVVSNIGLVRAFGAAKRERARLSASLTDEMSAQRASLRALERIKLFHALSVFVVTVGILVWSVTLWRSGRITTGDVVLTTTLGFTLLHGSRDVAMALVELVQQFAKLGEAVRVLGQPHEIVDAPDAKALINLGGAIDFSKVCFSYPGSERVLQDFDMHIGAGQKVGLVGRSGAGKSTTLALIQRLYDPETGRVLIDGQDIAKVGQESLRQSIAVVHQDISVFHRSVLENLRYGRPEATEEEVYRAAEAARCLEFIHRLPQGFDTIVGERGLKLSGGERQRLAIARAFLRNAPIILLDEATSALDTESEQLIQDALARLIKGRTVVAIAHRLSTLAAFDRIIVMDRGRIIEDGTAAELMRLEGTYAGMFTRQFGTGRP